MANPAIKKGEILPEGYLKRRLYTKAVEHLGQTVTESDNANAQTGIAKNRTIRIMMIRSENFFLFILSSLPFSPVKETAFLVPTSIKGDGRFWQAGIVIINL